MSNQNTTKLFAFKLVEKKAEQQKPATQWKTRDGVATAGCTGPDARMSARFGYDNGIWC